MKIGIELNDVVRSFSKNFGKYFVEGIDHTFDCNTIEFTTNELNELFPFKSDEQYRRFVYEDYIMELFGKCPTTTKNLSTKINKIVEIIIPDMDLEEPIEVMFFSSKEYGATIGYTYFFLSKIGSHIREIVMPKDSLEMWDKCDIIFASSPYILENKPSNKTSIKINMPYNEKNKSDFSFNTMEEIIDNNNIEEIITYGFNKRNGNSKENGD